MLELNEVLPSIFVNEEINEYDYYSYSDNKYYDEIEDESGNSGKYYEQYHHNGI